MKLQVIIALSLVLLVSQVSAEEKLILKDQKDKVSYSIGTNIGNNFKKQSVDINPDALVQGIKDALSGEKALMTEQEMNETMKAFQQEMMTKQAELAKIVGEKNKTEGDIFLAENKKKKGVITLPSGLEYKVINEGSGAIPKLTDKVTVHYRGTLIDGTEFDSSYRRGQTATFPVNGIIAGWKEALQLMKAGSKWQLFIPPTLAYGERGAGRTIGPNATLIFDIELLSIEEGAKP
ncbi:MAG: FKBP-type peptidyl-prolyl cis-trans isomerase [Nitrospirota bacterium]|nr:FKBP-type peptidyl-prolyl cis-trans isomerase [Nitrospirota bacterium]